MVRKLTLAQDSLVMHHKIASYVVMHHKIRKASDFVALIPSFSYRHSLLTVYISLKVCLEIFPVKSQDYY